MDKTNDWSMTHDELVDASVDAAEALDHWEVANAFVASRFEINTKAREP